MIIGTLQLQATQGGVKAFAAAASITGLGATIAAEAGTGIVGGVGIELTLEEAPGQGQHLRSHSGLQCFQIQFLSRWTPEQRLNVAIDLVGQFHGERSFF